LRLRVWGLGFGGLGLGFQVWGLGFGGWGLELEFSVFNLGFVFWVQASMFRVLGFVLRVGRSGLRVEG